MVRGSRSRAPQVGVPVTWIVRVAPDAEAELEASARWYDEHAGLRTEFIEAIDEALFAIAEGPHRNPPWSPDSTYRKYVVHRFPYVIVYRMREQYVEILAFAHTRRRPEYWKTRG